MNFGSHSYIFKHLLLASKSNYYEINRACMTRPEDLMWRGQQIKMLAQLEEEYNESKKSEKPFLNEFEKLHLRKCFLIIGESDLHIKVETINGIEYYTICPKENVKILIYKNKINREEPKVGEIWRHNQKQLDYKIIKTSAWSTDKDPPEHVVDYEAQYNDTTFGLNAEWRRNMSTWMQTLEIDDLYDGKRMYYPRFYKVQNATVKPTFPTKQLYDGVMSFLEPNDQSKFTTWIKTMNEDVSIE